MPTTYVENLLLPISPLNIACARTWMRLFLKDKPDEQGNWPDRSMSDEELEAYLVSTSLGTVANDGPYYRPHLAAANVLVGDPERIRELRYDDFFKTLRRPEEIVKAWYEAGRAFDALIPAHILPVDPASVPRSVLNFYETFF